MANVTTPNILVEGVDRISDLPDEILGHILSFLRNKDAITTTILSHRWENLWAKFLPLKFDEGLFSFHWKFSDDRPIVDCLSEYGTEDQEMILPYFMKFVDKALTLREYDVSIKNFEVDVTYCKEDLVINKWIEWAISRNVENLYVSAYYYDSLAPSSILDCKQLIKLKLHGNFLIDLQNSEICLPNLKSIDFLSVAFGDEIQISNLLSGSPLLEEIVISNLTITRGPRGSRNGSCSIVETFGLLFNKFYNIVVESSPSKITEVRVDIDENVATKIQQLVDVISHAKEFGLYFQEFHFVPPPVIVIKLPVLHNLKTLRTVIDLHGQQYFSHILECVPNLRHFHLHLKDCKDNDCSESHCMLSSPVPRCVATCLESIDIRCTQVMKLIGFVGGFLKYANVLKKMSITRFLAAHEEQGVLEELHKLPKASAECQINLVL